jgi:hypothetical protein
MRLLRALALLVLAGCGTLYSHSGPPAGLTCDHVTVPPQDGLSSALNNAFAGDCVILAEGTYTGAFVLPKDVSLAGSEGAKVVLTGDSTTAPVLTIHGGQRSSVLNLRVDTSNGDGIAIDPGPANLVGVTVTNASEAALSSSCTAADCDQDGVTLTDVDLFTSGTGLHVVGGRLDMTRGTISQMNGTSLTAGNGIIAAAGAKLSLHQTVIADNAEAGILIDGAKTQATIEDCVVSGNLGRGIWVQNTDAGVSITGGMLMGNKRVGIGVLQSGAVNVSGVTIRGTINTPVTVGVHVNEPVGDGVGLFTGAHQVTLDSLVLEDNARAQILADEIGAGNKVLMPTLKADDAGYRVVVQRSSNTLDVSSTYVDTPPAELVVDDALVTIPN